MERIDEDDFTARLRAFWCRVGRAGGYWFIIATLIESRKLCGVDPRGYLAGVSATIADGHHISAIGHLQAFAKAGALGAAARERRLLCSALSPELSGGPVPAALR